MKKVLSFIFILLSIGFISTSVIIITSDKKENKGSKENNSNVGKFTIDLQTVIDNDSFKADIIDFESRSLGEEGKYIYYVKFKIYNKLDKDMKFAIEVSSINGLHINKGINVITTKNVVSAHGEASLETNIYSDNQVFENIDLTEIKAIDYRIALSDNLETFVDETVTVKTSLYEDPIILSYGKVVYEDEKIEVQYIDKKYTEGNNYSEGKVNFNFLFKNKTNEIENLWVKDHKIIIDDKEYSVMFNDTINPNRYSLGKVTIYSDKDDFNKLKMSFSFFEDKTYQVVSTTPEFEFNIG